MDVFKQLILSNVPIILIYISCFWYRSQELCILWRNTKSSFFSISNGVRQSGILSPKLFYVYMDDLSTLLINFGFGCFIDNVCFNHVFHADDLCLMAPCAIVLQELLNICHSYSISVDVNFNAYLHQALLGSYYIRIFRIFIAQFPLEFFTLNYLITRVC